MAFPPFPFPPFPGGGFPPGGGGTPPGDGTPPDGYIGPPRLNTAPTAATDSNAAANSVAEGAAVNTLVGITAHSTDAEQAVTYTLASDNSGGGFKIDPTTGVVTVADPAKINFETAPGHAYTITVNSSDGITVTAQNFTINVSDVAPSTPVDSNAAANTVAEGAAANTLVGITASSTDINGPGVTYSLSNNANGAFKIDAATGVVSVADPSKIDFESTAPGHVLNITAVASDGTLSSSQNFAINVSDVVLTAPVDGNGAANSVAEGAANGSTVGVTAVAVDPNGPATTYSLTADSSLGGFTINAATGVVTVADSTKIDYETSAGHAHSITVQATNGVQTTSQAFTIGVTDVAPSAPVDSNAGANTIAEGAANGSTVGVTASSTDVNGPGVTYSLVGDSSGGGFTINAATGVVTVADSTKINFETAAGHAYTVTAQASDGTLSNSQTFTIAVSDVAPSTPVDSNAGANAVVEGVANGSAVGITASSTDVNGPGVTYSIVGDTSGGGFTINAATGIVIVADATKIDYETAAGHAYNVTVQASDGTLTSSQVFAIAVSDVAPSTPVDSAAAANTIAEGAANGSTVGVTASSLDVNGPAVTYSLIGDTSGGGFTINAATGVISVVDSTKINYETATHSYTVIAQASDGTLSTSQAFTIDVTDVAPTAPVDSDPTPNVINEGISNGVAFGLTAASTDINGGTVTYSLIGDSTNGGFTINTTTGVISVADTTKVDYETSGGTLSLTVQASDGTLSNSHTFTVVLNNTAPSVPVDTDAAADSVAEGAANGSAVGFTASSTDPGAPDVTYSLADSAGGRFAIDAVSGVVTVANSSAIDYETAPGHAYTIVVRANDAGGMFRQQSVVIAVTDVAPSAPVDSNGGANNIAEGAANGSTVGVTAASTDVNGPAVTYSLTNDSSGGGFTINAATGIITVVDSTKINYETATHSYTVTAQASDGTLTNSQIFTIGVTDVAPSTPVDSNGAVNQVAVSAPNGSTVGLTASSTDINGPAVTYTLMGDTSGGGFAVNAATGVVTVADTSKIIYNAGSPTYDVTVDSSDGTLHSQQIFTIAVVLDVAPVVTAGHTLNYTENQAATAIDPALTVIDTDNANLVSATVQIGGGYVNGEDVLGFTNQNGITGSFNAGTGTLTLTGSSSVANYQTALASVTYVNGSDNPSGAARTVTFITNDGTLDSAPATGTINVAPVNDAPVVVAGHTLNYTENQAATAFDTAITASDVDSANLASATVQITGNYANGQDVLGFTNQNGITGSFNAATGTLTLTGSSSVANYQTALASVTYVNTSENPSGLARTVTIITNDGAANSVAQTDTINVTPVNDAPVTTAGGTLNYTENQAATAIDASVTVSDVDSANLSSATVVISNNYVNGEDVLSFTNQNGITGSFNAATGTLTLTGSSSLANYQTALDSVKYSNTSDNPSAPDRTVSYTVNDGALNSNTSTSIIHVTPVNDAPVVNATGTLAYTENQVATAIAPALTVTDADTATLTTATVQISANYVNGEDVLAFTNTANITGSFNAATGTMTLTGTDTVAHYQTALESVTYANSSENPSTAARTVTFTADDGQAANHLSAGSNHTITVASVNDAPVNNGVPAPFTVMSGFTHAITGLSVTDIDANGGNDITTTLTSVGTAFVTVGAVGGGAAITGNGTNTVTLTGTIAAINASLGGSVVYTAADGVTTSSLTTLTIATNDHGHTGTPGAITDTDIISVGVTPQVWFIDQAQTGLVATESRGSQLNPFSDITEFNAASLTATGPGNNDTIYMKAGTYTGPGINLKDGQTLLGDDQALSVADPFGGPAIVIETASGARPTINVTTGGDQGIDLASGNTIAGINITTATGTSGLDDGNNAVGNLTVSHMAISGAGQAIDIDQGGGALNVVLDSTSSSGGAQGIQLAGAWTGTFNAGSGTLSGHTAAEVDLNGGAGAFSYSGAINDGSGLSASVNGRSGGSVLLSGTISDGVDAGGGITVTSNSAGTVAFSGANSTINSGASSAIVISSNNGSAAINFSGSGLNIDTTTATGIDMTGNAGASINFTGGNLTIDATTGSGMVGTSAGTVTVTGTGNHIATTIGSALNLTSTTIGASDVTFQDISATGSSAKAGIILDGTGSSGGLHVTGNGANVGATGGGVIANKTGADILSGTNAAVAGQTTSGTNGVGIFLRDTSDVQLNGMQLNDFTNFAIYGNKVTGFSLDHSTINGTNGSNNAGDREEGSIRFDNLLGTSSIKNSGISGGYTQNVELYNTSGTLTRLTMDNIAFGLLNATGGNDNVNAQVFNSAIANFTLTNSTFAGTRSDFAEFIANNNATMDVVVQDNVFHNGQAIVPGGGVAVSIRSGSGGNVSAAHTTFDVSRNVSNDGGANSYDTVGMFFAKGQDLGTLSGTILGNTIGPANPDISANPGLQPANADGIFVRSSGGGTTTVLIQNNNLTGYGNVGIHLQNNDGSTTMNASVFGNIETSPNSQNFAGLFADNGATATDTSTMNLVLGSLGTAALQNTFAGVGIGVSLSNFNAATIFNLSRNGSAAGTAAGVVQDDNVGTPSVDTSGGVGPITLVNTLPVAPLLAGPGGVEAAAPNPGEMHLTQAQLDAVVAVAIAQWAAAGASQSQLAMLHATTFSIADLSGSTLGEEAAPAHITIDIDAAGRGWFVDPTPHDNFEFAHALNAAGTDLLTDPTNAAAGHFDLLTTVSHELGHVLGLADTTDAATANGLMFIDLAVGERRLPGATDIASAPTTTASVSVGTAGNDTIDAGHGGGVLFGGGGADNFVFSNVDLHTAAPPAPITHVTDYSFAEGDRFDFSALTSQFHATGADDAMIVRAVEDASGQFATLQVNATDPGAPPSTPNWVSVAQIDGVHAGDAVNVMVDSHSAVHLAQIHVGLLV